MSNARYDYGSRERAYVTVLNWRMQSGAAVRQNGTRLPNEGHRSNWSAGRTVMRRCLYPLIVATLDALTLDDHYDASYSEYQL